MGDFISKKTISRIAVIQALYQFEINNQKQNNHILKASIKKFYAEQELFDTAEQVKINNSYFEDLLDIILDNILEIDQLISGYLLKNSELKNLDITTLSILRSGIAEMKYFPETPSKVVINEYTTIANDMAKSNEIGFVNSILNKYAIDTNRI